MIDTFGSLGSLFLAFAIFILVTLSGCENPGAIGEGVPGTDADVEIENEPVDDISVTSYDWYSGAYPFFSAGEFNDPFFGTLTATGMIKPALPTGGDSVATNATMLMRLILDDSQTYGDSMSVQNFDIYEIQQRWRGEAWMLKDDVQLGDNPIGSFEVEGDEDSLDVNLSADWVENYRQYAETEGADSSYKYEEHGLALVPANSNKVIALNSRSSRFVIQNPESDTFAVALAEWAYSLNRGNGAAIPENSVPLHSTFESIITTDLGISGDNISGIGISRAELVLYENTEALGNVERASAMNAFLYLNNPEEAPENIALGNPIAQGSYSSEDNTFRFNITNIVQNLIMSGMPEGQQLFVRLPNDGVIISTLIYTEEAPADKAPKVIITSIKSTD